MARSAWSLMPILSFFFFFSSRRRHTRCGRDWSSDVCSSDLDTAILRVPSPALQTLDSLAARTIAASLPALTLGIAVGVARLRDKGGSVDALMAVTVVPWLPYGAYLPFRYAYRSRGRRPPAIALPAV